MKKYHCENMERAAVIVEAETADEAASAFAIMIGGPDSIAVREPDISDTKRFYDAVEDGVVFDGIIVEELSRDLYANMDRSSHEFKVVSDILFPRSVLIAVLLSRI